MFQLFLKTNQGNTLTIDVHQLETIYDLKKKAYIKTGVPTIFQLLLHNGKILLDHNTIEFYNMTNADTVYMNLRMSVITDTTRKRSILGKRKSID